MPARWGNRKPQTSFPYRDTDLTTYGPKSLYENSRNQLRSCSTPGKHKAKNNCIEMGKKKLLHFTHKSPYSKPAQLSMVRRKCLGASPLGRKETSGRYAQCSGFEDGGGLPKGLVSIFLIYSADEDLADREPVVPQAGTRERKKLQDPEKERATLSNWEIICINSEKMEPTRSVRSLQNLYLG